MRNGNLKRFVQVALCLLVLQAISALAQTDEGERGAGVGEGTDFDLKDWLLEVPENQMIEVDPEELEPPQPSPEARPGIEESEEGVSEPTDFLRNLESLPEEAFPPPNELRERIPVDVQQEEVDPFQLGRLPPEGKQSSSRAHAYLHFEAAVDFHATNVAQGRLIRVAQEERPRPVEAPASNTDCAVPLEWPFDLRRSVSFWRQTDDAINCSEAVKDLRSLRAMMMLEMYDDLHDLKLFRPEYICDDLYRHRRTIVQRYADSCLYRLPEAERVKALTDESRRMILSSIGVIDGIGRNCVGTISSEAVYTSKHCFYRADAQDGLRVVFPPEGLLLHTFSGETFALAPPDDRGPATKVPDLEDDWVALPFAEEESAPKDQIILRPDLANPWQPLLLVSPHRYLAALSMCGAESPSEDELIKASLIVDITPGCTIFAREGDFIYHGCQTQKGMSGTPLLTIANGDLGLLAIHSGSSSALDTPCSSKLAKRYPNFGVVPDIAR